MLRYIKEFGKYVEITGYRKAEFEKAEQYLRANRKKVIADIAVQFFDAQLIATSDHLYFAVLHALNAFQNKTNHSNSPAMETMLYASAKRQIQKAIERCGINPKIDKIGVVIIGDDPKQIEDAKNEITEALGSKPDDQVLKMTKAKAAKIQKAFEITDTEIKTLENSDQAIINLVFEAMALLATQL